MTININIPNITILFFVITLTACKPKESSTNYTVKNSNESIFLIENTGIEFEYEIGNTTKYGKNFLVDIKCIVKNKTNNEINYLNQSCNGLEYSLVLESNLHKVMPQFHCNATWTMINKIKTRDSLEFNTRILKTKHSESLGNIGLDFRVVNRFISLETLKKYPKIVKKVYQQAIEEKNIIWAVK